MTGIGPDVPPDLVDPPQVGADGCFAVPTAPGLGVRIDPAAVA